MVTCPHLLSSDLYRWAAWVQVTIRGETRGCPVLTGLRRGPPGEGEVESGLVGHSQDSGSSSPCNEKPREDFQLAGDRISLEF